jgi:hypothetical protein
MIYLRKTYLKPILFSIGAALLALPLALYSRQHFLRPPQTQREQALFQGITYRREARLIPRSIMLHIITIDLTAPGLKAFITPGKPNKDGTETNARTTSAFLKEFKLQLAVNANYFYPFREDSPWDYYPYSGDRVNSVGQAIANGYTYSDVDTRFPVLCFSADNLAQISKTGACSPGTTNAVAGSHLLLVNGKPAKKNFAGSNNRKPYPCIAAALNRAGTKLWLVAVDGKQPLYSEGVTLSELTEIIMELGAQTAINLDGGGSTTLVVASDKLEAEVLNAPIHTKIPMRERPVANHLGFYALPLENSSGEKSD